MSNVFFTCKIDDHVTIENEKFVKKMNYIDVQCCMICVNKRKCDENDTIIQNVDENEKENT